MPQQWNSVEAIPRLEADELQVWRIELSEADAWIDRCGSVLSRDEMARAERRVVGRVRNEFILGRCCLRILLAANSDQLPVEISLHEDAFGKPRQEGHRLPEFNVSHSYGTILIALTNSGSVGVDVEHLSPSIKMRELAPSVLSRKELEQLKALPDLEEQRLFFYRMWTRKEAAVKADGRGLSIALTELEAAAGEVHIDNKCYRLSDLPVEAGLMAAVAIESHDCRTTLSHFPVSALKALPVQK